MDDTQVKPLNIRTKTLANGAVYDLDQKRIVANPGGGTAAITQANASALARMRWEKYRRAGVREIVEEAKSINPAVMTSADAYGLLLANQYTKLLDSDKPNIDQTERLGKMLTGMDLQNSQRENASTPGTITADPDTLMQLISALEREKQIAVDRARAVDVDSTDMRNE
jgi:hypothetical protein